MYSDLTKSAAESYARALWTRHAFALDAELASLHEASGRSDLALKVYSKLQKAYVESRSHPLLLDLFPRLTHCQRVMKDWPGLLSACACTLSLEPGLVGQEQRGRVLKTLLETARQRLDQPATMEVPSLLAFSVPSPASLPASSSTSSTSLGVLPSSPSSSSSPSPPSAAPSLPSLPLMLSEGDPVALTVCVWSGMPADLPLDSITLTLAAPAHPSAEEGIRVSAAEGPLECLLNRVC